MQENPKILKSISLLILLGLTWGSGYMIAKYATMNGVSPLGYSFWQSLGPAILLLFLTLIRKPHKIPTSIRHLKYYFICGLIGIAIPNTMMYFAAPHLPAGLLAVIVNTVPMFTYLLVLMLGVEKFSIWRLVGILVIVLGIMLVVSPGASWPEAPRIGWVVLTLITPLSFALCAIYISKAKPEKGDALAHAAGMLVASAVILTPFILIKKQFYPLVPPFNLADFIIMVEIVLSSLGYVIFFKLLKSAGAVFYSLTDGVVVIVGLSWGALVFHESLNLVSSIAILLIVISIGLMSWSQNN